MDDTDGRGVVDDLGAGEFGFFLGLTDGLEGRVGDTVGNVFEVVQGILVDIGGDLVLGKKAGGRFEF